MSGEYCKGVTHNYLAGIAANLIFDTGIECTGKVQNEVLLRINKILDEVAGKRISLVRLKDLERVPFDEIMLFEVSSKVDYYLQEEAHLKTFSSLLPEEEQRHLYSLFDTYKRDGSDLLILYSQSLLSILGNEISPYFRPFLEKLNQEVPFFEAVGSILGKSNDKVYLEPFPKDVLEYVRYFRNILSRLMCGIPESQRVH